MEQSIYHLTKESLQSVEILIPLDGYYKIQFSAISEARWDREQQESLMLRLFMDDVYNQDVICWNGDVPHRYERLIGYLEKGTYRFGLQLTAQSKVDEVSIQQITLELAALTEEEELVCKLSPVIYGRNVYTTYDQLYTDTPLMMIYKLTPMEKGKVLEFHVVFSHEDEGTPANFLMVKWGRLLDIEYSARIFLSHNNEVERIEYQGDDHAITNYPASSIDYPVLQTASCHGTFRHQITSDYSTRFVPKKWDATTVPREFVMEQFSFVNRVMIWEAERQLEIQPNKLPYDMTLVHPSEYAYIHATYDEGNAMQTPAQFSVKFTGDDQWYSSSFSWQKEEEFLAAYTGDELCFATSLKCPPYYKIEDIVEISVEFLPDCPPASIEHVRVFELTKNGQFIEHHCVTLSLGV